MKHMKKLILAVILATILPQAGWGATYCVKQGGTVTADNKANAAVADDAACTAINSADGALNMVQVRTLWGMSDGDNVVFSAKDINGNDNSYTDYMVIPQGGTSEKINYRGLTDGTGLSRPVLDISVSVYPGCIRTNTKSNIYVGGFTINYTGGNANDSGVILQGTSTNVTVDNVVIDMALVGYAISSGGAITQTNFTLSNITGTRAGTTNRIIYLYATAYVNLTMSYITVAGSYGAYIKNVNGLTMNGFTSEEAMATGLYLEGLSGTSTISNLNITKTGAYSAVGGLYILASSGITITDFTYSGPDYAYEIGTTSNNITLNRFTSTTAVRNPRITGTANNITIRNSSLTNPYGGFLTDTGTHDITYDNVHVIGAANSSGFITRGHSDNVYHYNCSSDNNSNNGYQTQTLSSDSPQNVQYWYCEASGNGTVNNPFEGGGFIPHDNTVGVKVYYSIAHDNYNEGLGAVGTGDGIYYNNVSYNNCKQGGLWKGANITTACNRGNTYFDLTGGNGFIIKNNIFSGGGLRERLDYHPEYTTWDYNLYYPLDNAAFTSNDNTNNISWATYSASAEPHSLNSDPLFMSAGAADFRLQSSSPAINSGVSVGLTTDYAGLPVPFLGGKVDRGAYEFQSGDPWTIGGGGRFITFPRFPSFPSWQ